MGIDHIVWVLDHSKAEHGARLVMLTLAEYTNERDIGYPSIPTIARRARLSERAVQKALRQLVEMGELAEAGTSEYGTTKYHMVGVKNVHPGEECDARGVKNATGNGAQSSPEPLSKPPESQPSSGEQLFETPSELDQLWAHYQETVGGASRRNLDSARRSCMKRALKVRSLDECKRAIDGLARSSWHNGDNPDRKKYLDIQYALGQKSESADERIDKAALWAHTASAPLDKFEQVIAQLPEAAKVAFRRWRQDGRFGDLKRAGVIPVVSDGAITHWKYERPSDAS